MPNYRNDTNNDELCHYGVLGMKWGVRRNPAKAYAKSKRELDKRTQRYEKQKEQSTRARSSLMSKGKALGMINENRKKSFDELNTAKKSYESISSIDRNSVSIFKRGLHDKAVQNAADKVKRIEESIINSQTAEAKLRGQIKRDNRRTKRLERWTSRDQRRVERFKKAMDKNLSGLDKDTIAAGEQLYNKMISR